jgi:hypothetical protein
MGKEQFIQELRTLGYCVEESVENRIIITGYAIQEGRFANTEVQIGLEIPQDFPVNPPTGPHISPRLLPLNPSGTTHNDKAVESPFGNEWEYLSRPYPNNSWGKTNHTVRIYMLHVINLLKTL